MIKIISTATSSFLILAVNIRFNNRCKFVFARPPPVRFYRISDKFSIWCINWKFAGWTVYPSAEFVVFYFKKHLRIVDFKFRYRQSEAFNVNLAKSIVMIVIAVDNLTDISRTHSSVSV